MPHTPGPWKFDEENEADQGFDVVMADGGILATAYYDCDRSTYSVEQAVANAHLIAASPALLAACKAALSDPQPACLRPDVVRQLADAVARAEGR